MRVVAALFGALVGAAVFFGITLACAVVTGPAEGGASAILVGMLLIGAVGGTAVGIWLTRRRGPNSP
jgi:hypothetical protein